ncbi:GNAT family N-acetyltransferase [Tissierella praeacuta]|uniref:GNAT family N-acetyltransferase n=1 Tax=Tissierella praeacuta TaxID=43131 RepID=UPI003342DC0A
MENIEIKKLGCDNEIPYDLLLLADPSIEIINDYLHRGNCYLAYIEEKIVGVYVIIRTRPMTFELVNIAVDEAYQGKGIGKALLFNAIDNARELKGKILEVGTGNSSISQLTLYQKCGFRITGVDRNFFRKHYKDKIIENGIECIDMIRLSMNL